MGRRLRPGWPERPGAGALRACCSAGAAGGGGAGAPFRPCACAACCATRPARSAAVQRPPAASSRGQPRGSCRKGTPGGCRRASAVQRRNGSGSNLPRLPRSLEQVLPEQSARTPRCQPCPNAQLHAPAPSPTLRTCSGAAPGAAPLPPAAVGSRPGTRHTCPGLPRAHATVPGSASAHGASSRCRRRAAAERRLAACPHPRGRSGRRGALLREGWAKDATGCEASADQRKRTSGQVALQQADCPCGGPPSTLAPAHTNCSCDLPSDRVLVARRGRSLASAPVTSPAPSPSIRNLQSGVRLSGHAPRHGPSTPRACCAVHGTRGRASMVERPLNAADALRSK